MTRPHQRPTDLLIFTPRQTSGGAFAAVSFVYLSVECPFYKFYGIDCRAKLGAKLLQLHGRFSP
jgi:hypothetical protein